MPPETDSLSLILSLLADVGSIVLHAQASVDHGQPIELSGLNRAVSLLCAKALDLPPPLRRQAAFELATLRDPVERLCNTLAARTST